jgi:CYTH domain-containing protein/CHAD domain-containing protein
VAEIERKFVVAEMPADLDRQPATEIRQGYLAIEPDATEARVRRRGSDAFLTVKRGTGQVRDEEEIPLDAGAFAALWPFTEARRIEKRRHLLAIDDGPTIELDVYGGDLAGLAVAEIEFEDEDAAAAFAPPAWMGREVTDDARFKNQRLATDGLPGDPRDFRLDGDEALGPGIRRIARGRIDHASEELERADGDAIGEAIHTARKNFKRERALVRLVRDALGDERYRHENAAFRDAGRQLGDVRDAKVLVETLDALLERNPDDTADGTFAGLREALVRQEVQVHEAVRRDKAAIAGVVAAIGEARARVDAWPVEGDNRYGALAPGFERIYRRGRRALRAARKRPDAERLHELRKRTKDLWHASQIARPVAPKRMKRLARRAHRLSDLIGDDHDLAVLREAAQDRSETLRDGELEALTALIARRQKKLQRKALKVGSRVYRPKPREARRLISS